MRRALKACRQPRLGERVKGEWGGGVGESRSQQLPLCTESRGKTMERTGVAGGELCNGASRLTP